MLFNFLALSMGKFQNLSINKSTNMICRRRSFERFTTYGSLSATNKELITCDNTGRCQAISLAALWTTSFPRPDPASTKDRFKRCLKNPLLMYSWAGYHLCARALSYSTSQNVACEGCIDWRPTDSPA